MNTYGKENILWRREKPVEDPNAPPDVEDWVNGFFLTSMPVFIKKKKKKPHTFRRVLVKVSWF